jgi:hypothetical protein
MNPSAGMDRTPSTSRWIMQAWLAVIAALAAFPIIGNAASEGFDWGLEDGLAWGGMLSFLAIGGVLTLRWAKSRSRALIALTGLIGLFLLVWVQLAVGLFG